MTAMKTIKRFGLLAMVAGLALMLFGCSVSDGKVDDNDNATADTSATKAPATSKPATATDMASATAPATDNATDNAPNTANPTADGDGKIIDGIENAKDDIDRMLP